MGSTRGDEPVTETTYAPELATAARVKELAMGLWVSAMMMTAVRLRVPDEIDDKPVEAAELAARLDLHPGALARLLRALAAHGVFEEAAEDRFGHTPLSRVLREDDPHSVRYQVLWTVAPWTWRAWPHLEDAVRTGERVFPGLYGKEFFAYLSEDAPESAEIFNRAMTQSSSYTSDMVAGALDLTGVRVAVDVGGGRGHLLRTLLERHPALHGVLHDLPSVVASADPALRPGGELAGRVRLVGGSCLDGVPSGDLYILKNLLEWDDERTVATLRNVAAALRTGGRAVLVQNLVDDSPEPKVTTGMDLLLLLNVGGRKHTRRHLVRLLAEAGLEIREVRPTASSLFVIEVARVAA
ncbi:methyltransferase [Streptomyces sp. B1866]|uniref:methyltransferase n=1 Tax=Streptomyces sp. B1866 TaxID=3075431 RepID=UPI0028927578|nr:methyltransferase [Streptomyces sp. B1866]MDT3397876.1 methyltransferase [Streptomyces sp. B1866]